MDESSRNKSVNDCVTFTVHAAIKQRVFRFWPFFAFLAPAVDKTARNNCGESECLVRLIKRLEKPARKLKISKYVMAISRLPRL